MDARLVDMLPKAMGFKRGDAHFIQNAGTTKTPTDEGVIRSLVAAIAMGGITEIFVVGHTGCGMATDVLRLIDGLSNRGIRRDVLGNRDIREWFGVISGVDNNVRDMVNAIRSAPMVPRNLPIHGLVVETDTGRLKHLVSDVQTPVPSGQMHERMPDGQSAAPPPPLDYPTMPGPVMKPLDLKQSQPQFNKPLEAPKMQAPASMPFNSPSMGMPVIKPLDGHSSSRPPRAVEAIIVEDTETGPVGGAAAPMAAGGLGMDDLARLDDESLRLVMGSLRKQELAILAKASAMQMRLKLFKCMSKGDAAAVWENLAKMKEISPADMSGLKQRVGAILNDFSRQGKIAMDAVVEVKPMGRR
jgi:carbonic anhydrase